MLVDVSHLSDPGFWDVAEELSGPFFASHSNARAVFSHPRNLTDEQFTAIIDHNGVVGLNLYANFLGERADLDTAIAHLEHWLELGGERTVALGGDLDGCSSLPEGITGIQDLDRLWELLQRNYSEALVRALFFENLMRVVSEVCTM
jgi:membrane dipeptidase